MTPKISLQVAQPRDSATIASLIMALAIYEKAPEKCMATPDGVREQLFGPRPAAEAIIATVDEVPAGMALYFQTFSTWVCRPGMYLEDLFVLPEYRRLGVGGLLMKRLGEICLERNYGRLEWACLEWNELAKGQYRKIGATPMEDWRTWRLEGDAIKPLAAGVYTHGGKP